MPLDYLKVIYLLTEVLLAAYTQHMAQRNKPAQVHASLLKLNKAILNKRVDSKAHLSLYTHEHLHNLYLLRQLLVLLLKFADFTLFHSRQSHQTVRYRWLGRFSVFSLLSLDHLKRLVKAVTFTKDWRFAAFATDRCCPTKRDVFALRHFLMFTGCSHLTSSLLLKLQTKLFCMNYSYLLLFEISLKIDLFL